MKKIRLARLLNHLSVIQLVRFGQLDPTAIIEVNDGIAEQILFEMSAKGAYNVP